MNNKSRPEYKKTGLLLSYNCNFKIILKTNQKVY